MCSCFMCLDEAAVVVVLVLLLAYLAWATMRVHASPSDYGSLWSTSTTTRE